MEQPGIFKTTAMGGFDKQSVLRYVDELCERGKKTEQELTKKLEVLENKNRDLTGTVELLNAQLNDIGQRAQSGSARERTLEQSVADLQRELNQQRTVVENKDRELRLQQDKCRELTLQTEELEQKSRRYDESVMQVGEAMLQAQENAAAVVRQAEEKASRITATTIESIHTLAEQIGAFKGDVTVLRTKLQSSLSELEERLDSLDGSIDTLDNAVKTVDLKASTLVDAVMTHEDVEDCEAPLNTMESQENKAQSGTANSLSHIEQAAEPEQLVEQFSW